MCHEELITNNANVLARSPLEATGRDAMPEATAEAAVSCHRQAHERQTGYREHLRSNALLGRDVAAAHALPAAAAWMGVQDRNPSASQERLIKRALEEPRTEPDIAVNSPIPWTGDEDVRYQCRSPGPTSAGPPKSECKVLLPVGT
jgi:hypothetical protein